MNNNFDFGRSERAFSILTMHLHSIYNWIVHHISGPNNVMQVVILSFYHVILQQNNFFGVWYRKTSSLITDQNVNCFILAHTYFSGFHMQQILAPFSFSALIFMCVPSLLYEILAVLF